ncbi:MAG: PaaI family thioesterase [Syntrophales bacterium]|jgi:uncharacterized protein (TIGR00369 family)|nr:PaaI family thioesterase [Syntrophales bacterium]
MNELPENILAMINEIAGGFDKLMGLRFVKATPEEYVAELDVDERHLQPYGIVHGGVYSATIETLCSLGAALSVYSEGKSAVGLENSTSFLRAVRSGTIRCTARPVFAGKRSQVWEGQVTDDRERLIATGRVRLIILEQGSEADGIAVGLNR